MPTLAKNAKGKRQGSLGLLGRKKRQAEIGPDDEQLGPPSEADEIEETSTTSTEPAKPVQLAKPFQGDIVSSALRDAVIIPRILGSEVTVLNKFLQYYSQTEPYMGSLVGKSSFMHKKGGLLL